MDSYFSSEFFEGNRRRLQELFTGTAPIVLTANGLMQRNADNSYLFRQDSSFWYLTGLTTPDVILVMDKDKQYLIVPDLSPTDEALGAPHDLTAMQKHSGIDSILTSKEGWKRLGTRLKRVKHIATLAAPAAHLENYGMYTNPARARLIEQFKSLNPDLELLDLRQHLTRMRVVKQEPELRAIQRAVDITVSTMKTVQRRLPQYAHEYEIEADLSHGFRKRGALGHSFLPVVAGGKNTCHIHYQSNSQPLADARYLYIDTGAEVEHYAADITRTYFLKQPTKRERAVYDAVKDVHDFALSRLRPGITLRENEDAVDQYMGEKLRELGLIKTIEQSTIKQYFGHLTSHFMGLDVHDVGSYDIPLSAGMVLTVEPGIYIKKEGLGVRIENDVLITKKGCKVLSASLKY